MYVFFFKHSFFNTSSEYVFNLNLKFFFFIITCQRWSQKIADTLTQQHQTVRRGEPVQRYEFHQDGGRKREIRREEQSERGADDDQRPKAVDEQRHDGAANSAAHQANGVHLGHVHPRVISGPAEQYLTERDTLGIRKIKFFF